MITDEMILRYKETKDEKLFEEIYQEYIYFRTYLLGLIPYEDLDEITSNCNYALAKSIEYFDSSKGVKFTTYLANAILNTKYHYYKKVKPKYQDNVSLEDVIIDGKRDITLEDTIPDDRDYYKDFENREFIKFHLSLLEDEEREIIEMYFFKDMQTYEIANKLNKSQGYVSIHLNEILHKMRRNIILYNHK